MKVKLALIEVDGKTKHNLGRSIDGTCVGALGAQMCFDVLVFVCVSRLCAEQRRSRDSMFFIVCRCRCQAGDPIETKFRGSLAAVVFHVAHRDNVY